MALHMGRRSVTSHWFTEVLGIFGARVTVNSIPILLFTRHRISKQISLFP